MMPVLLQYGHYLGSALLGVAGFLLMWQVGAILLNRRAVNQSHNKFELARRAELRKGSSIYRWFEPLVEEVARLMESQSPKRRELLRRQLLISEEALPWTPTDFLATKTIEGVLAGLGLFLLCAIAGQWLLGLFLGGGVALGYQELARSSVASRAHKRLQRIRLRLPYAVDLICLMMEAGGGFQESLHTVVRENKGHPLGDELNEVVLQVAAGRTRHEALRSFQDRMCDDDVSELVFAINKGEELGTPLSVTLRNQAEQMRLKRSQWGEKAAGEAQVKIVFPGMVIMIACLLVIVTPLVFPLIVNLFGS
jgi:tight adherence protein C